MLFYAPGDVPRIETDNDPYLAGVGTDAIATTAESGDTGIGALQLCAGGDASKDSERRIVNCRIAAYTFATSSAKQCA